MAETPTVVPDEYLRYISERTQPEDDFLRALKAAAREAGIPAIWISPEQGSFLQILLRLTGGREVVEVGTLAGYSAITMARALPAGGRVRTIELEPKHADFAAKWVAASDVAGRVEVHRGAGRDVLAGFADASADAFFIDADKPNYRAYVDESLRIVRPGGLVMVDNAFAFGRLLDPADTDPNVAAIRAVNDYIAAKSGLRGIITPVGDGLWVAVRE